MRLRTHLLLNAFTALAIAPGSAAVGIAQAEVRCMPAFAQQTGVRNGWMGADAAYSVPLAQGRDLWIFGDTLLGPKRAMKDGDPVMTRNSLGISRCDAHGHSSLQFIIPQDAQGEAKSVFVPADATHWYWPMDGFIARRRLWIELLCLRQPQQLRPGAFNFESCGVDLASSPVDVEPGSTQPLIQPLNGPGDGASMSSTTVVNGPFAYFFGIRASDRALLLSRVQLSRLPGASHALQYLSEDGRWGRDVRPPQARVLFQPGATEMSVRYHADRHQWLAIYKDPDLMSDRVVWRSSPALGGPWSPARELFAIRDLDRAASRPGIFCYAGKEHPELAIRGELVVTYVCNASNPAALMTQNDVYLPRLVRVALGSDEVVRRVERIGDPTPDGSVPSPGQTAAGPE